MASFYCRKLNLQSSMKAYTGLTAAKYAKENQGYGKEGGPLSDNDEHGLKGSLGWGVPPRPSNPDLI